MSGIAVRIVDRAWPPGSGAAYDWIKREVLLPPEAANRDAVGLAVTIAHEGYHALEAIERGMLPCIEAEQDAAFAQFVVYVELVARGGRRIADDDPVSGDLQLVRWYVRKGDLKVVDDVVAKAYVTRREQLFRVGNWLRPLGRLLVGFSIRASDAVWDLTENFETLDRKEKHLAYWWNKDPVKRARAAHEFAIEWKMKWIIEHRYEEFPGF